MIKKTNRDFWERKAYKIELPITVNLNQLPRQAFHCFCNDIFKDKQYSTLIEIGCSPGKWLHYFNKYFSFNVSGLEYSNELCLITKRNLEMLNTKVRLYNADLFRNNINKKFDVVFSFGFMEHFDDLMMPLNECYKLLKPGGLLLTIVPNLYGSMHEFLSRLFAPNNLSKHVKVSTEDCYSAYKKLGLKQIRTIHSGIWSYSLISCPERYIFIFKIYKRLSRNATKLIKIFNIERESSIFSPYILASGIK